MQQAADARYCGVTKGDTLPFGSVVVCTSTQHNLDHSVVQVIKQKSQTRHKLG
jgi:hypothetical protein